MQQISIHDLIFETQIINKSQYSVGVSCVIFGTYLFIGHAYTKILLTVDLKLFYLITLKRSRENCQRLQRTIKIIILEILVNAIKQEKYVNNVRHSYWKGKGKTVFNHKQYDCLQKSNEFIEVEEYENQYTKVSCISIY